MKQLLESIISKFNKYPTLDTIYPVGSLYWSMNSTNPSELFGGTGERIKDQFILAAGDNYAAGNTGGEAEHVHSLSGTNSAYADFIATSDILIENYVTVPSRNMQLQFGFSSTQTSYNSNSPYAVPVKGSTDTANNMPPYLVAYCGKRIS